MIVCWSLTLDWLFDVAASLRDYTWDLDAFLRILLDVYQAKIYFPIKTKFLILIYKFNHILTTN